MKKTWSNPEVLVLSLHDTFGGPTYVDEADDVYFDAETNMWWKDYGTDS